MIRSLVSGVPSGRPNSQCLLWISRAWPKANSGKNASKVILAASWGVILLKKLVSLIIRDAYALSNNDTTKFADWVAYRLTPEESFGTISGNRNFRSDPFLHSSETLETFELHSRSRLLTCATSACRTVKVGTPLAERIRARLHSHDFRSNLGRRKLRSRASLAFRRIQHQD